MFVIEIADKRLIEVHLGQDVSELLGIEKYLPPIPAHLAGEVANVFGHTAKYDFERLESIPDMFEEGEEITATEKLHGSFCAIIIEPNFNHPDMFGETGNIIVHSKGLGAQGLAFKNVPENYSNLYVKVLKTLLENGLEKKLKGFLSELDERSADVKFSELPVVILGEVFGKGVQDLHYGFDKPVFRIFDIRLGNNWQTYGLARIIAETIGCEMVPELYKGPFNKELLETYRDGKTTLGNGANVREGIVIRGNGYHPIHGRKIAKMISPDYLLRKAKKGEETTEFN
jgi:RNA ligase (TIGR02306 family)